MVTARDAESADMGEGRFPWELRPDVEVTADQNAGAGNWILRDPLRLTFFRTTDAGIEFLRHGHSGGRLADQAVLLQDAWPEEEVTVDSLRTLAIAAISTGLVRPVIPGVAGTGVRRKNGLGIRILQRTARLCTFRWRGIDPTWLLQLIHPIVSSMFSARFLLLACGLMLWSLAAVLLRWDQLLGELPELTALLTWQNLIGIGLAFGLVRLLHEMGHALACYHFGGECHELGVHFFLFIPLLYCDVSDSWRQPQRHRRMAVAGAGIFVELCVAAICGLLWAWSAPGLLHTLFLNLMLVSSVNTVLVNGNPLVRFDGYYMLSDLLGIPNLWSLSRSAAAAFTERLVLGLQVPLQEFGSRLHFVGLTCLGYASFFYRLTLTLSLLLVFYQALEPAGLQFAAFLPGAAGGAAGLSGLIARLRFIFNGSSGTRRRRMQAGIIVASVLLTGIMLTPVELPVHAPCVLNPGTAQPVYAAVNGRLVFAAAEGAQVANGDVLARLQNEELELELAKAEGECSRLEASLRTVNIQTLSAGAAAEALPVAEQALAAARARLASLQRLQEQLVIRSPSDGVVFLPRNIPVEAIRHDTFQSWRQQPLKSEAIGAWIDAQTLLCWVGQNSSLRVDASVEQPDIARIPPNAPCTIRFLGAPSSAAEATVENTSSSPMQSVDRELILHNFVSLSPRDPTQPQRPLFLVQLRPGNSSGWGATPLYSAGMARIQARPLSLAARTWRLMRSTFGWSESG
jgi:putative peptide zinc metalloprotease protein